MKRRLGTALLALALLQMLLPATALAAEADNIVDTSALEYFEIPLIDPRDPPAGTTANWSMHQTLTRQREQTILWMLRSWNTLRFL